ncbi:MAG: hypothetical protein WBH74_05360 [Methanothermobacter thermautotrophicus]
MPFSDASTLPFLSFGRLNSLLRGVSVLLDLETPSEVMSGDFFLGAGLIAFSGVIFLIGAILDGSEAMGSDADDSPVEDFISSDSFVGVSDVTGLAPVDISGILFSEPSDSFSGFSLSAEGTLLFGAPSGALKVERPTPTTFFSGAPSTASGALKAGCLLTGALLAGLTFFLGVFFSDAALIDSRSILPANRRVIIRPGTKRMRPRKNIKISGGVAKPSDMK